MNASLIYCLLLFFQLLNCVAQENPWELKGKNPWVYQKGENPWVSYQKNDSLLVGKLKETGSSEIAQIQSESDSILMSGDILIDTTRQTANSKLLINDFQIKQMAKQDYKANASFVGSMITCSFFNVFAIPVNLISSAIPVPAEKMTIKEFDRKFPDATKEQRRLYKSTIQVKRTGKALGGSAVGIGINILIIAALLI